MSTSVSGRAATLVLVLALLCMSAQGKANGGSGLSQCDPLVPEHCMFPFPNNFWLRPDAQGRLHLNFTDKAFPIDESGNGISAERSGVNNMDGFSPVSPALAYFPNASIDNCPRLWNMDTSLHAESPTILLNADTGERVMHWVELDHSSDMPDVALEYPRALLLWPSQALNDSARYIVAFRGLRDTAGNLIQPSKAFKALRDNEPSSDPDVNNRRHLFSDIFSKLKAAGVSIPDLQLAWDYTVTSKANKTQAMVHMRDDAMQRVGDSIKYNVISTIHSPKPNVALEVHGQIHVPWYLNSPYPGVDVRLVRGADGMPAFQGYQPVNFTVLIPNSVATLEMKGAIMQYGHGLFGSQSEMKDDYLVGEANQYGYILAGVNWDGMCKYDELYVGLMVASDLSNFNMVPDRLHQGMLNALLLMRALKTSMATAPFFYFNNQNVLDASKRYYYGNSLGGILGTVYMSLSQDVDRGVLGVAGAPFALLLPRSVDFTPLFDILKVRYFNALDRVSLFNLLQTLWDRLSPDGYMRYITSNPLPNTSTKRVAYHYGLGDAQVSWLGTHVIARTVGAVMFESNVREGNETLAGFKFVPDDAVLNEGSVVVGWDFGAPEVPFINIPPVKHDDHEFPRRTTTAQEMTHTFLTQGVIKNYCNGPCKQSPPQQMAVAAAFIV